MRFFPPVIAFILEGDRRHCHEKISPGPKDTTGKPAYVDYTVKLPLRSLDEFLLWVYRYMNNAQVLSPPALVKKHTQATRDAAARYL